MSINASAPSSERASLPVPQVQMAPPKPVGEKALDNNKSQDLYFRVVMDKPIAQSDKALLQRDKFV